MLPSSKIANRWIALIMWLALLAALIFTSADGIEPALRAGWVSYFPSPNVDVHASMRFEGTQVLVTLALLAILMFQLLRAWLRFGAFTINLLVAYSKVDTDEGEHTIFASFLTLAHPTSTIPTSNVSDVLRPLGYAWAVIIVVPLLPYAVAVLSYP